MSLSHEVPFDPNTCDEPLYSTRIGGYVIRAKDSDDHAWFADIPSGLNNKVGDFIPREWDLTAANDAAKKKAGYPQH